MARGKNDEEEDGGTGLGRWWWASAAVVGVVVLAGAWVAFVPGKSSSTGSVPDVTVTASGSPGSAQQPPSSAAAVPSAPSSLPKVPGAWPGVGCNGTSGSSKIPTQPPSGVSWVSLGSMSVPTGEQLGPRHLQSPYRQCFQHSPAGALLAAANIGPAASVNPAEGSKVLMRQMTPGAGRDSQISDLEDPSAGPGTASPSGFTFGACAPTVCQLTLLESSDGYYVQIQMSMVWTDGDWKVDGQTTPSPAVGTTMPVGYVPWSAGGN